MIPPMPLPRSLPESQGVSSAAVLSFLDGIESSIHDLHGFMLLRHGSVIAEGWWRPYGPELPHMLFSLSKSFTSTAVGFAVTEGRLSVDDTVLSFFPKDAPREVSDNLAAMKVRHLLTMTTGQDMADQDAVDATFGRRDHRAEKAFLALPVVHAPGSRFVYNSSATYMLSAIVQKLTGQALTDYLTPRLFDPLGIRDARWDSYANGVNFGGFGLNVRTEDIARFGQCYLDKGAWNGRQVIPGTWVAEATARQVPNGDAPDSDWSQGYGYQFWRCRPRGAYRGDGAFGQYCIVMPEQDAVIAINSGLGDMQVPLAQIWEKLLPGMHDAPLAADSTAAGVLGQRLACLHYDPPAGRSSSPLAAGMGGIEYALEKNALKLTAARFDFRPDSCTMTLKHGSKRTVLTLGFGEWREGTMLLPADHAPGLQDHPVTASGVWTADDAFVVTVRLILTPFVYTFTNRLAGNELLCDPEVNVSFGPTKLPQIRGCRKGARERP
jgi:CubicO group peptidase (beta-lactamase class C family)